MTMRFTARAVGVDEDDELECLTAGVAEDEDGEGMLLLFMCGLTEPDEEDAELGEDTHCLVTADQGTAYGAVRQLVLRDRVLRVRVDDSSLEELGLDDPEIEAVLDVDDAAIDQLRLGLARIMAYGRPDARPAEVEL
ncbi:Imm10 family immunity protein [Actinophytocola xanthii]|uniref:Immunity protein 10 n=1 Tax=Actinophytocola xanthii TaxID=1912961 RepID=A0A1Q8C8Z7_9PSEU|nr:Imm10 family immunity protein [Actinophytocola xanthii]OLF10827.1 hypothetical protein BU204_30955 [Actinophytocola xanthii]